MSSKHVCHIFQKCLYGAGTVLTALAPCHTMLLSFIVVVRYIKDISVGGVVYARETV